MLIRLLGACAPKTEEGTMLGKLISVDAAATPISEVFTNVRRDIVDIFFIRPLLCVPLPNKQLGKNKKLGKNKLGRGQAAKRSSIPKEYRARPRRFSYETWTMTVHKVQSGDIRRGRARFCLALRFHSPLAPFPTALYQDELFSNAQVPRCHATS